MNYNFSHFSLAERESEIFADKLCTKNVTNQDIGFGGNRLDFHPSLKVDDILNQ